MPIAVAILASILRPAASAPPQTSALGDVAIVQAPPGTAPAPGEARAYRDPAPDGSRLVLWTPGTPPDAARVLTEGFAAAGMPAVSADGARLLFSGRMADGIWSVWEVDPAGGAPRRVTPPAFHALHPDYVAGDRIVFASDRDGGPDPVDGGRTFSLYTCERDGSDLARITFHPWSDTHPTVLRDGRVLFASWQPPGDGRDGGGFGLFTVRNDGTGILPFHGSHDPPFTKARPRELDDGRVAYVASEADAAPSLVTVELRRPMHSRVPWSAPDGFTWLTAGPSGYDTAPVIAGLRPAPGHGTAALYLPAADGAAPPHLLFDDPARDDLAGVPIRLRPRPRGIVSDTRPGSPTGTLLCLDARRTDRTGGAGETTTRAARVRIYRGDADLDGGGVLLDDVALAADGSFLTDVPADTPLRFETVDAGGRVLLDSKGWVWVRPGEQRACIGCHEDREAAPSNRVPMAVLPASPDAPDATPAPTHFAMGATR